MDSLYQRLKELDPDTFHKLCFHLLKERHPGAGVHHVAGDSGDEGLDQFAGELSDGPAIWQCKSFPNGVGKSQRQQVRESLKRALTAFSPRAWVLCLSVDMDSKAYRWFQRLQNSYREKVQIGLFPASDIVHELLHRRVIRDHFFPGAVLDPKELKQLLTKSGELSAEELERVNEANVEDYIERLRARDARFNYEVVFSGDLGPGSKHSRVRSGLVLSIGDSSKIVNVFARDREGIKADPPKFSVRINASGIEKFKSLIQFGLPQEFSTSEVQEIKSDWALLDPLLGATRYKLSIGPSAELLEKRVRARLTFRSESGTVEYAFLELRPSRAGTDEVELVSTSDELPFRLSFVLPLREGGRGTWTFDERFSDHSVRSIHKFVQALAMLIPSGEVELYDLEREHRIFLTGASIAEETEDQKRFRDLIAELIAIEDRFNVKFQFPRNFSDDDIETLLVLKAYMTGGTLLLDNVNYTLEKSKENERTLPEMLANPVRLRMEHPNARAKFLGLEFDLGPTAVTIDQVSFIDLERTLVEFREAPLGGGIRISIKPLTPVQFTLI